MPSSQTITSFYTFSPYTKSRSIQVNANFSNLRWHALPIDPNTATAVDQTYDMGVSDYRWRAGYMRGASTSISAGSSIIMSGHTADGFQFKKSTTTVLYMQDDNFQAQNRTPMDSTLTAAAGQFAMGPILNSTITGAGNIAACTCTLTTVGRPVMVGLMNVSNTTGSSGIVFTGLTTTATILLQLYIAFLANGTAVASTYVGSGAVGASSGGSVAGWGLTDWEYPSGGFWMMFFPAAGTYAMSMSVDTTSATTALTNMAFKNTRLFAFEL